MIPTEAYCFRRFATLRVIPPPYAGKFYSTIHGFLHANVIFTESPFFQNEKETWITIIIQEQEVKTSKGDLWFLKIQWDANFIVIQWKAGIFSESQSAFELNRRVFRTAQIGGSCSRANDSEEASSTSQQHHLPDLGYQWWLVFEPLVFSPDWHQGDILST